MTTTSTFYKLSFQQQADVLLSESTFLLSRVEDSFVVDLYELDDIMVEIFYQRETEELVSVMAYNTSEKLKFLTNGANLQPRLTIKREMPVKAQSEFYA